MGVRKFVKPSTIIPILAGLVVGGVLFILGDTDDAPGLSLIGLVTAFLLIVWGVYNTSVIHKRLFLPIILLCFGIGGILFLVAMMFDGEFGRFPSIGLIGIAICIILITIGAVRLKKTK